VFPQFVGCISRYAHSEQDESEEVTFEVFVFVSSPFVRDASTYCSILSMNYEGPGAVCSEVSLQIESQLASECAKESGGTGESSFDYHCQKFRHSAQCAAISWSAHPSPHRSSSDLEPALRSSMHVERSCPRRCQVDSSSLRRLPLRNGPSPWVNGDERREVPREPIGTAHYLSPIPVLTVRTSHPSSQSIAAGSPLLHHSLPSVGYIQCSY
jgi:hypothetical protein